MLLDAHAAGEPGLALDEVVAGVNVFERAAGRDAVPEADVASILDDLVREGFARTVDDRWAIA